MRRCQMDAPNYSQKMPRRLLVIMIPNSRNKISNMQLILAPYQIWAGHLSKWWAQNKNPKYADESYDQNITRSLSNWIWPWAKKQTRVFVYIMDLFNSGGRSRI